MAFSQRFSAKYVGITFFHRSLQAGLTGLAVIILSLSPNVAVACAFDMVKPERTAIDHIVESERLVLARPGQTNPFAFEVTTVLVGSDEGPPIEQLVDSTTRRSLASNPSHEVLFTYAVEDGWKRIAYVDESFRFILDAALDNRSDWRTGMTRSRLDFVTKLQGRDDRTNWSLVIGELDKVPYPQLREMDLRIPDNVLRTELWTKKSYPYQAIIALLVGLSDTQEAREQIHAFIEGAVDRDRVNNLGAFAAAYLELEGIEGVRRLDQRFLQDRSQTLDKLEQIVMAMSVHHGLDQQELKNTIHNAIGRLVSNRPEAGAIVARQFSQRTDWSQASQLEPLVRDRQVASMADMLTISVYLGRAREAASDG